MSERRRLVTRLRGLRVASRLTVPERLKLLALQNRLAKKLGAKITGSTAVRWLIENCADQAIAPTAKRRGDMREKLPDDRRGMTLHFVITTFDGEQGKLVDVDGYVQTGEYDDGRLGEIFIKVGKSGDNKALLDQWAIAFSVALQHGAPLGDLCKKFVNASFEPYGPTNVPGIARCTSPVDLVCRWLAAKYVRVVHVPEVETVHEITNGSAQ